MSSAMVSSLNSSAAASPLLVPHSTSSSPPAVAAIAVTVVSKCTVYPEHKSTVSELPLSVSDLPMLSCHYIQKGLFFPPPPIPVPSLLSLLTSSLSSALSLFPALAGRLSTLPDGRIFISCNDAGVEFSYAVAPSSFTLPMLLPPSSDVPSSVKSLFPLDGVLSFHGHFRQLAAFQLTELADGAVFLGAAANHSVVDGTSFWNFFNSWAELCRGGAPKPPDFCRNYFGGSKAVLRFPNGGGPEVSFSVNAPLRERIFRFSREAILDLKSRANQRTKKIANGIGRDPMMAEIFGKQMHDALTPKSKAEEEGNEVSSFQSLCAHLWRAVTRARKRLSPGSMTTFRMAVNCRHRVVPRVSTNYFGNAIQSIPTQATVGEVVGSDLRWTARLLLRSVVAHDDAAIRLAVAQWEAAPRCFPLGNPDGAGVTMGSSHRFPMYENDFGWGRPVAVRSGRANKFDGKMSAFPGRDGDGSVELEVCLEPETMAALLCDDEFINYVSDGVHVHPAALV